MWNVVMRPGLDTSLRCRMPRFSSAYHQIKESVSPVATGASMQDIMSPLDMIGRCQKYTSTIRCYHFVFAAITRK